MGKCKTRSSDSHSKPRRTARTGRLRPCSKANPSRVSASGLILGAGPVIVAADLTSRICTPPSGSSPAPTAAQKAAARESIWRAPTLRWKRRWHDPAAYLRVLRRKPRGDPAAECHPHPRPLSRGAGGGGRGEGQSGHVRL